MAISESVQFYMKLLLFVCCFVFCFFENILWIYVLFTSLRCRVGKQRTLWLGSWISLACLHYLPFLPMGFIGYCWLFTLKPCAPFSTLNSVHSAICPSNATSACANVISWCCLTISCMRSWVPSSPSLIFFKIIVYLYIFKSQKFWSQFSLFCHHIFLVIFKTNHSSIYRFYIKVFHSYSFRNISWKKKKCHYSIVFKLELLYIF